MDGTEWSAGGGAGARYVADGPTSRNGIFFNVGSTYDCRGGGEAVGRGGGKRVSSWRGDEDAEAEEPAGYR